MQNKPPIVVLTGLGIVAAAAGPNVWLPAD